MVFVTLCRLHNILVGHDPRMLENVYMGVLNPWPDVVVSFALKAGVYSILANTRSTPVLADAAILRASDTDLSVEDCPRWYSYDYKTANEREVPPTQRSGPNLPGPKLRAREGVKVSNLVDIQAMFDEKGKRDRQSLTEAFSTPFQKVSPAALRVSEQVGPVDEDFANGMEVEVTWKIISVEVVGGKDHTVDSRHCRNSGDVEVAARKGRMFVVIIPSSSMRRQILMWIQLLPTSCPMPSRLPGIEVIIDAILNR